MTARLTWTARWLVVGIVAVVVATWAFPRAHPLFPREWRLSKADAEAVALERLADLRELPTDPWLLGQTDAHLQLEHRLQRALDELPADRVMGSRLARNLVAWEIVVYPRDASAGDWSHRARITPDGRVVELRVSIPEDQGRGALDPALARERADAFLARQGVDLTRYEAPELRERQLRTRTDLTLRYRDREALLGPTFAYGVEVFFDGDTLSGFAPYTEDPQRAAIERALQPLTLMNQAWAFGSLLLVPLVAVPFVLLYHAGEVGVRRPVQIAAVVAGLGIVTVLFCARGISSGWQIGVLTRPQVTLVVAGQMVVLFFVPQAILAFLGWAVGESICRERWSRRLAAFDALFQGDVANATFARAALRGAVGGAVLVAGLWGLGVALRSRDVWLANEFVLGPWWTSAQWFAVPLVAFAVGYGLFAEMFGRLLLVSAGVRYLGRWLGLAVAVLLGAVLFFPYAIAFPFAWGLPLWLWTSGVLVFLFHRYGIFTSVMAGVTGGVAVGALPLLTAENAWIQGQAAAALLVVLLPLLVSLRHLASGREFVYRYEDVPPHVRRIAERERQRVELETARGIQSSILPDLPSELNGVRLAHAYLPATEVGGDFYDVLALDDGRLAVAVGDVAGHGVSSGLVMSMAKSALAVQVGFQPEVEPVFRTLNRMVFQSARRRLLTTLCYALLDPRSRRLSYASAGHLFPYRVSPDGTVLALESVSYPLGVRDRLEVRVRHADLDPGDTVVLFSDGVVEAHARGSDELYGFDRLEESLARHAGGTVEGFRDGILADLDEFTARSPREDDLTVLVLQVA